MPMYPQNIRFSIACRLVDQSGETVIFLIIHMS